MTGAAGDREAKYQSRQPPSGDAGLPPHASYRQLVEKRKGCNLCPELVNPSVVDGGQLDSDEIGPYSRWQGNLHARLVVIGQDFADIETFRAVGGWPGRNVSTNATLVALLAVAGIDVAPPRVGESDDTIFLTNGVLCLKKGGMQASVPRRCFEACGRTFLRPLIDLIQPLAVVTLGRRALEGVLSAYGIACRQSLAELADRRTPFELPGGSRLFPRFHPCRTVLNTVRSLETQREDWRVLGAWLKAQLGEMT